MPTEQLTTRVGRRRTRWPRKDQQFLVLSNHDMGMRTYYGAWMILDNFAEFARVYAIDVDGDLHRIKLSANPLWWRRNLEFVMDRGLHA